MLKTLYLLNLKKFNKYNVLTEIIKKKFLILTKLKFFKKKKKFQFKLIKKKNFKKLINFLKFKKILNLFNKSLIIKPKFKKFLKKPKNFLNFKLLPENLEIFNLLKTNKPFNSKILNINSGIIYIKSSGINTFLTLTDFFGQVFIRFLVVFLKKLKKLKKKGLNIFPDN